MNGGIWVIAEISGGILAKAVFELISKAGELAKVKKTHVGLVLIGEKTEEHLKFLEKTGISVVFLADDPLLKDFHDELYAETIVYFAKKYKPEIVLGAATIKGRSLMPRVAVLLKTGLTADCTGLEIHPETGKLMQTRPAFGGNILATIICETLPQMSTVRPHVFSVTDENDSVSQEIRVIKFDGSLGSSPKKILSFTEFDCKDLSLADSRIIVAAGMGVGGPAGIKIIKDFAESIGAAVGASRSVVDSGWLDYSHQIGQTGITVHPQIYIACGISGAVQHLAGMQNSEFVIAINKDPDVPIFGISDIGVTGNIFEVIPLLTEKFRRSVKAGTP